MTRVRFSMMFLVAAAVTCSTVAWSRIALTADEPAGAELRTWNDATGTHSLEATFVEFKNDKVKLRKKDGSEVSVPIAKLSKEDQTYIRTELARRRTAAKTDSTKAVAAGANRTAAGGKDGDGEWNQWRGPRRDGISTETGLLKSWPDDGPPLAWQVTGLGGGFSSVAIAHGRIYTMGLLDGDSHLIALDEKDGKILWKTLVREGDSPPNCTPTVEDDIVIGLGFKGDLLCVDAASGKEIWRKSFERDFGGKMMSGWGYSESPLIDGDRVICTPGADGAMLAALDKRTGNALWTTSVSNAGRQGGDGAAYSSVVISNGGGVKQYVQLVGRGVIGVSAENGQLLWGYNRIANGTANIPTPIVKGDFIFCSTGYNTGAALLKLSSAGRGRVNAEEVYFLEPKTMQNHHGGMILLGDHVYCGHGHNEGFPLCIELATGREAWRPGRGVGSGSAAIAYADGHLYFRYQNGVMALIEATPAAYKLKGNFTLASRRGESWPHPVIARGKLYARDQEALLCYDIKE